MEKRGTNGGLSSANANGVRSKKLKKYTDLQRMVPTRQDSIPIMVLMLATFSGKSIHQGWPEIHLKRGKNTESQS
jgi:hypothetical protein